MTEEAKTPSNPSATAPAAPAAGGTTAAPVEAQKSAPVMAAPSPPAEGAAPASPGAAQGPNPYDLAEEGWTELIAAAGKVQDAAQQLKKSERSIDGYNIERALMKHKPALLKEHLKGLREHRKEHKL